MRKGVSIFEKHIRSGALYRPITGRIRRMLEINTWERIHVLSHFHTVSCHRPSPPHFELLRCREVNAATTESIYAERTVNSLCASLILSAAAWIRANNQSQTCCFTHVLGRIPPQHRAVLLTLRHGFNRIQASWCRCLVALVGPDKNQRQSPQFPEVLHGKAAGRVAAKGRGGPLDPLGEFGLF